MSSRAVLVFPYFSHVLSVQGWRYAHILIVVALIIVNFFSFLVITRYHGGGFTLNQDEIVATSLPELPKPSKTFKNLRKTNVFRDYSF